MKRLTELTVGIILLSVAHLCVAQEESAPRTGILGAFDQEVALLAREIEDPRTESIFGVDFIVGKLEGREVILAQSGIGKVNAAVTTTLLIDHFRPSEILFTGIAGSINPELLPGDIVIAESTTQHDYGALTATGFFHAPTRETGGKASNPLYFPADETLLRLALKASRHMDPLKAITGKKGERIPRIVTGIVATGDVFIASSEKKEELRKRHKADAVEMEGAAVAQVCHGRGVPCLIIRSMSDNADESASADARRFQEAAADNSAKLVIALIRLLEEDLR